MSLFQYGNYRHPANEVNLIRMEKANIIGPRGKRLTTVQRMMIEIVIQATTPADLTTRVNEIITAYETDYWNAQLYSDDAGTVQTPHRLTNSSDCLSGVKVIRGPVWDRADSGEYAVKRTASVTLEATYDEAESDLVFWREKVRIIGTGGPDYAVLNTFAGPVSFPLSLGTPQRIIQSGEALGFIAPVLPPGPSFSNVVVHAGECEEDSDSGRCLGTQFRFFPSSWTYVMTSLTPTSGAPITR